MYQVLFITDDWKRKKSLKSSLLGCGFKVFMHDSAELLDDSFVPQSIDVAVVDLEDLKQDLAKILQLLRRDGVLKDAPQVLLVPEDRLGTVDFQLGHDDYLTLPLNESRFTERLKFLMWRLHRFEMQDGYVCGDLMVDFERYEIKVKGALVDLTFKEFELLKFLILNPHKVFTREVLLDKVWGYDYYGGTRTVDVHIRRLRSKIETGSATYVETVRNVGYKFVPNP